MSPCISYERYVRAVARALRQIGSSMTPGAERDALCNADELLLEAAHGA